MLRLGEESSSPMYFRSEQTRPGGYNYYNRVFNSDGSHFDQSHTSDGSHFEQSYTSDGSHFDQSHNSDESQFDQSHNSDRSQFESLSQGTDRQYQQYSGPHLPSGDLSDPRDGHGNYPPNHIMSRARDQFRGEPDVNQYYHFYDHHDVSNNDHQHDHHNVNRYDHHAQHDIKTDDLHDHHIVNTYDHHDHHDVKTDDHQRSDATPTYYPHQQVESGVDSHSSPLIEYADIDLADDYDDYGMEIDFEQELNRIEHGAGLIYQETGENLTSRDSARVYVADQFSNGNGHGEQESDFVYDLGFYDY